MIGRLKIMLLMFPAVSKIWIRMKLGEAHSKRWFGFMVLNATFNNISVILWWSVLLMEETGGPRENHWPVASHWQTLSHNVLHLALIEIRTLISGIGTDCIGSCKSNDHTLTATHSKRYWNLIWHKFNQEMWLVVHIDEMT